MFCGTSMRIFAAALVALVSVAGCSALPSPMARAQETAQEFNMNTRYGRNELAAEKVAASARQDFVAHHRAWGSKVRIAEVELQGLHPKGSHDAEVLVHVEWYRPEEQELRTTTLKQSWHDANGWELVAEQRVDGDIGLLGEPVVFEEPPEAKPPAQFPTVHLAGTSN
jgi:hypothetical protein